MACKCPVKVGEMVHKIIVEEKVSYSDQHGGYNIQWTEKFITYARAVQKSANEGYGHSKKEYDSSVEFAFFYAPTLNPTDRILFNGNYYNIKSIDNLEFKNKYHIVIGVDEEAN
jgi:head-tail adaptor